MRLIDADALTEKILVICKDCERRKGMKNGKLQTIYRIGDAPCRACWVDDIREEIDLAPTIKTLSLEEVIEEYNKRLCDSITKAVCSIRKYDKEE